MSPLEIAAVLASAVGIWLTTRRKLSSWPIILVSCFLYAVVFQRAKLYSDMLLQFVYAAFAVYGWWHWWHDVKKEGSVRVESLSTRALSSGTIIGALGSLLLGFVMARLTDAALPYADSSLTSFSLVAQFWQTRKHIANWWLWIVIDTLYVAMFIYKNLYLTAALYAFFVFLALLGLRAWQRAFDTQLTSGTPASLAAQKSDLA